MFYHSTGIKIPYLAFADDIIIFTRASEVYVGLLASFLQEFQAVSGQRINVDKSNFICFNKVPQETIDMVQQKLGFSCAILPFRYL